MDIEAQHLYQQDQDGHDHHPTSARPRENLL